MRRCKSLVAVLCFAALGQAPRAVAESGADALMKSVSPAAGQPSHWGQFEGLKLNDPFLAQLFSEWQSTRDLSYEVNAWVQKVLRGESEAAAHLWSAIQTRVPDAFTPTARAAQAYLAYRLDLAQTFFKEWLPLLADSTFRESRIGLALEQTVAPGFDAWLWQRAPEITPEQEAVLLGLDATRSPVQATLKGFALLRKGQPAAALLGFLPPQHALKISLSETAALAYARQGDLAAAAKVLKEHLEPAIEAKKDPKRLGAYYLQIARLLYQAGALDGAEQFYEKVPNGIPEYLKAREELAWIFLRKGDTEKLRGDLETLTSKLFEREFSPEVYVVRAVSNLKLCYYDAVDRDLAQFIESNKKWAQLIAANRESSAPEKPLPETEYSKLYHRGLTAIETEIKQLERLGVASIEAALPAVGEQKHWTEAKAAALVAAESRKKRVAAEYRRAWSNRQATLKEAIRKMQFVKVELMTQVRSLAASPSAELSSSEPAKFSAKRELQNKGDQTFPFDGVVWADELFHLRSTAEARCLQARKD